jgi:hypothetical protein
MCDENAVFTIEEEHSLGFEVWFSPLVGKKESSMEWDSSQVAIQWTHMKWQWHGNSGRSGRAARVRIKFSGKICKNW